MFTLTVEGFIHKNFKSVEEFQQFLVEEQSSWDWMSDGEFDRFGEIRERITNRWRNLLLEFDRQISRQPIEQHTQVVEGFLSTIRSEIESRGLVPKDSPLGIMMRRAWDSNSPFWRLAAVKSAWLVYANHNLQDKYVDFRELTTALPIVLEKLGVTIPEPNLLDSIEVTKREADSFRNEINEKLQQANTLYRERKSDLDQLIIQAHQKIDSCTEDLKNHFESLQEAYDEKLRLKAPVTYWKIKAGEHGKEKSKHSRRMTWCAGVFLVALLLELVVVLIPQIAWDVPTLQWLVRYFVAEGQSMAPSPNSYLPTMSMLLVTISIFLLIFRPFWKMYLSAAHLEAVCKEKATMVEVYLSLIADNASMASEDRTLVLNSIFSTSSTGLVGGSDGPQIPIEAMMRFMAQSHR